MQRLSRTQIEAIGRSVWHDYRRQLNWPLCAPIDILRFAERHLGLKHSYARLSQDGDLLGLTTYQDTEIELWNDDKPVKRIVPGGVMLLEEAMRQDSNPGRLCFTAAHECAHQILDRLEHKDTSDIFLKNRKAYSCRRLNTGQDWQEWQANVLAAALLMPPEMIKWRFKMLYGVERFIKYGQRFNCLTTSFIADSCKDLLVSNKAFMIRLKELELLEYRKAADYTEDMDISFPWGGDLSAKG